MFSFKSSVKPSCNGNKVPDSCYIEESDMQGQLNKPQEDLRKQKEKVHALDEIEEVKKKRKNKKKMWKSNRDEDQLDLADRVQQLEGELEAARDSEKRILALLETQTEQLEQAKVSLEEAKLEIASLQDSNKRLEALTAVPSNPSRILVKSFRRRGMMSFSFADPGEVEISSLQRELRLAVESEEKCNKAMDDLAIALKEQSIEAREAKTKLSFVQAELNNARTEVDNLKVSLESTAEKLRLAQEEVGGLTFELHELAAASEEKERELIDCIKMLEGELSKGKEENDNLIESQRVIRRENSTLREKLKHALSEANVVRESVEIARVENSQLTQHIYEKESTLQKIMQDYESLKISEAAAQCSIKELMLCSVQIPPEPRPKHHLPKGAR
ncbi:hypothetical protein ACP70R_000635 [Stipagrostis hirtigluma subsp. patula]